MKKILVSGLINIEIDVKIKSFPIKYEQVIYNNHGINSCISGVGFNVAKALTKLGSQVDFHSIVGKDFYSKWLKGILAKEQMSSLNVLELLNETPRSVILYDKKGNRQINLDLKEIQNVNYPVSVFEKAIKRCEMAVLCNVNFSRAFLRKTSLIGKTIATDVHVLSDINDSYNSDFMKYANILFLSDEKISGSCKDFAKRIQNKYGNDIIVVGMGKKGAMLAVKKDNFIEIMPAKKTRKVVNTVGAGDALFSAFIHFFSETSDPYLSLEKALVFASWKIGESGGAKGFLNKKEMKNMKSD